MGIIRRIKTVCDNMKIVEFFIEHYGWSSNSMLYEEEKLITIKEGLDLRR